MNTKKTIQKILFLGMWLFIGAGMLTLLIAAMGKQKRATCKDIEIVINARNTEDLFLDEQDVMKLLKATTKGKLVGQPKTYFDLRKMEGLLEDNVWVKEAQLYFDNHDVLHVTISERQPVARVFTSGGRSFYVDDSRQIMQLSDKVSMNLPVFTGFPEKKRLDRKDSLLLADITNTATFITNDPFWSAQVEQLDIVNCGAGCWEFEMVPLVGNHIVKLGDGSSIAEKFQRLMTFYKQVLSQAGFDKYKTVDVRYARQVIGARTANPKVDSVQLRKSVEALLRQIKEAEAEALRAEQQATVQATVPASEENRTPPMAKTISNPNTTEKQAAPKAADPKPRTTAKPDETKQPKAVMKPR